MKNATSRKLAKRPVARTLQFPSVARLRSSSFSQRAKDWLLTAWKWFQEQQNSRSSARHLHLEETISLGQKRFIALVRVDGKRLLVGGGGNEVSLLANLGKAKTFATLLKKPLVAPVSQKRARHRVAKSKAEPEKCA